MSADSLIRSSGPVHKSNLDQLHNDHQKNHRHKHHLRLIAVEAVADGDIAQPAASGVAGHGGVAQNGCDGDGRSHQE